MKHILFIVLFSAFLLGCSSKKMNSKFDQLIGLWQTNNSETDIYETWKRGNDSVLYGKSYAMNGPDSMVFERVELRIGKTDVYYVPIVTGQNDGQPVLFKMIKSTDTSYVFENKLHDFPQRVIYRFIGRDSLAARIEGIKNGEERSEDYYYHRIKK